MMNVHPLELIFTSGGSESNNLAIKGVFYSAQKLGRNHFITSTVEHPSVMKTFDFLKKQGAQVDYVPVNRDGEIDLEYYEKILSEKTALVSIMAANNETGTLFPIEKMCKWAHQKGALFHTDAVQTLGKLTVNLQKWDVDLASFSAHKFYGLRGCGVLFQKRGVKIESLIHGGGQERSRRAGTENILAIAALGHMSTLKDAMSEQNARLKDLRDDMEKQILSKISGVEVVCQNSKRLPNTSSLLIDGVDGETLLMNLDMHGICVSTGAACSSGSQEPSPVLRAMGLSHQEAQMTLRLSLGWENTAEEISYFVDVLQKVVDRIRNFANLQEKKIL
jgi:cysteine desulfurase